MTVQAVAQGLGILAGVVVIRALDKGNYALYTLANNGIATFALLCNGGIVDAATATGGRAWQDPRHIAGVLASAENVRKRLAAWIAAPTALILAWMLLQNGASATDIVILLTCGWFAAHYQVSAEILRVALRLQGRVPQLRNLDLIAAILRAAFALALFLIAKASFAIFIAAGIMAIVYILTRRTVARTTELMTAADMDAAARIWLVVRRQWPSALAYIFQGQIVFLLLSLLDQAEAVADFGALGRIAAAFGIFGAALSAIVLPRYARCQDPKELRSLYILIFLGYTAVAMLPVAIAAAFPKELLWILGAQYANLDHALFLVTLNASAMSLAFLAWGLNSVRAWIMPAWLSISIMYGTQFALMVLIGIDTMDKVLWIGILWSMASIASSVIATFVFSGRFTHV